MKPRTRKVKLEGANGAEPQELEVILMKDGHPLYDDVDSAGNPVEVAFDVPYAKGHNKTLAEEIKSLKTQLGAKDDALKVWSDPTGTPLDRAGVQKALDLAARLNEKELMEAGKVQEMKDGWLKDAQTREEQLHKQYKGELAAKETTIQDLALGHAFRGSAFVGGTKPGDLALPPTVAHATFGRHFRVEEGQHVRAYLDPGKWEQPIYSRERVMQPATFDEALKELVAIHPEKDRLTVGVGATGSGQNNGGGAGGAAGFVLSKEAARNPAAYRAAKEQAAKTGQPLQIAD